MLRAWRSVVPRAGSPSSPRGDGGFTLAEVVVAFVLFMIIAATAGTALTSTLGTARSNEARVVAADLAARQIETLRGMKAENIADGDAARQNVVLDGRTYYLDQTVTLDALAGSGSACSGASGPAAFKRAHVEVTWERMNGVKPVVSDTLLALPVTGIGNGTGVLSVPVQGDDGSGIPGVTVALSNGSTAVTKSDGCAVFANQSPGTTYSATVATTGYVDQLGNASVTQTPVSVVEGEVTKLPAFIYNKASTISLTVPTPGAAYPLPTVPLSGFPALGVTLGNANFAGGVQDYPGCGTPPCAETGGGAFTVTGLFPATSGYQAWVGTCSTAKPAVPVLVGVNPGATTSEAVTPAGGIRVVVKQGGVHVAGYTVWAVNADCSTSEGFVLPGTSGAGDAEALTMALPAGTWTLYAGLDTDTPLATLPSVTVTEGAVTGDPAPLVVNVP